MARWPVRSAVDDPPQQELKMKLTSPPAQVQMPELVGFGVSTRAALLVAMVGVAAHAQTSGTNPTPPAPGVASPLPGYVNPSGQLAVPGYMNTAPPIAGSGPGERFRGLLGMPSNTTPYTAAPGAAGMIPEGLGVRWETGAISFNSSVAFSYTDNALQGGSDLGKQDDFIIQPMLGMNIFQQISESAQLSFNVGIGYRYSLNFDDLAQFNFAPNGTINYSFVVGDTVITLFDRIGGSGGNRPEIAGNGLASGVDFNRINNQVGISATHGFTEATSVSGMYGFTIDRGLSDQFGILDQDSHMVSAGLYHQLSPYWTTGVSGQAAKTTFVQSFQNGFTTYGAGPMLSFQPNEFIAISGAVQYTISQFDSGGQTGDTSDFSGLTYQLTASHRITTSIQHSVNLSSGVNSGLGSNFTETFVAGYQASWQFHERMGLNMGFTYSKITQSQSQEVLVPITFPSGTFLVPASFIANDEASIYDFTLGTGYQLTDRANLGLNYIHSIRDSRFATRSFSVNTVVLSVNYRF
jgi:hypothetical protein